MKNIIYTLLITFMITACADVPEEHSSTETLEKSTSTNLEYIDISNAESLYISSSTGRTNSRDESKNKLFKITEDGAVLELSFTLLDSDNNSYTVTKTKQPISIDNVNTDYVVFSFGADKVNVTECYLVHRSTGKIHLLGSSDSQLTSNCPVPQGIPTEKMILTDNDNNFYYRYYAPIIGTTHYYLRKVNYTNPDNITSTRLIVNNESIKNFVVDSNGNFVYNGNFWIGLDGNITTNNYITNQDYKFKLSNKLIFVVTGKWSNKIIIDNGFKTNTIDLPLSETSIAKSSSNYVYISGIDKNNNDTVIVKFNPNDNSFSKYTIGNYNLYNFNVTDNTIIFSALRKNDGKNVLGKIDKDGTLTITYESNFENLKLEK